MSSQADETPGEADPRWGMVTLARLQPGSKVQDRVRDKAGASVQIIFRAVAFFLRDQFISCRIAVVLPLEFHRDPINPS